ncbi:E set domain-containing protein [Clavulina sp. PMI_390]|nr:E set domain-containing protein [Clavulina sp. PMI_390]
MSAPHEDESDFKPTFAEGYKLGEAKTVNDYAKLDANDESLNRWKASLGITGDGAAPATGPKVSILALELTSPTIPNNQKISFDLSNIDFANQTKGSDPIVIRDSPITIKEGVEYSVGASFRVNHEVASGLRYIQVVKRAGLKLDKLEAMIGSYGPNPDGKPNVRSFHTEDSPSGMIARTGTYNVRSKFIDDDGQVYADFGWSFKLDKNWKSADFC